MYVLHGNLEAIETTSFCDLYFLTEPLHLEEIMKHLQKRDLQVRDINAVWTSYVSAHKIFGLLIAICKAETPQNYMSEGLL